MVINYYITSVASSLVPRRLSFFDLEDKEKNERRPGVQSHMTNVTSLLVRHYHKGVVAQIHWQFLFVAL